MEKFKIIKTNFQRSLYEINWRENFLIILCIIVFWPVGLYQMWKREKWNIVVRYIITILVFGIITLGVIAQSM